MTYIKAKQQKEDPEEYYLNNPNNLNKKGYLTQKIIIIKKLFLTYKNLYSLKIVDKSRIFIIR